MKVLELGCGDLPHIEDGWEHLDVRDLEHIEYVQSAVDLSNLKTEYDLIVTKDMIEHISWREIKPALAEWYRVLKPGGKLQVETPNALKLGLILERPDAVDRVPGESDFELFSRTGFGHQDYPANTHQSYYTEPWLRILLLETGFLKIETLFNTIDSFKLEATK